MVTPRWHHAAHLPIQTCPCLPALFVCLYHHPVLQHGYHRGARPSNGFLTQLSLTEGGGSAQGGCPGCVDSGGMGREGGKSGCILALILRSFHFFPPPSCGFMAYLPVADFHLAMRGDLWQICCRDFDRGSRRKGISSRAGPDDPGGLASSGAI